MLSFFIKLRPLICSMRFPRNPICLLRLTVHLAHNCYHGVEAGYNWFGLKCIGCGLFQEVQVSPWYKGSFLLFEGGANECMVFLSVCLFI